MAGKRVRIRSILIQDGGQGDGIMAAHGLQALIESGLPFLHEGATCYVRTVVEPLIRTLLPGLRVLNLAQSRHSPPSPLSHHSQDQRDNPFQEPLPEGLLCQLLLKTEEDILWLHHRNEDLGPPGRNGSIPCLWEELAQGDPCLLWT